MQLITMTKADLMALVSQAVRVELEIFKRAITKKDDGDILSRKETAMFLRVDLSTLWEWTRDGKLKAHKIGNRVYYKKSEIANCFTQNKAS